MAALVHQGLAVIGDPLRCAITRNQLLPPSSPFKTTPCLPLRDGGHVKLPPRPQRCGVVAFAAARVKEKSLQMQAEEIWQKIKHNPLDGVPFTMEEFENALSKYDYNCDVGDVVKGTVFVTDATGAFIDIGAKAPAYLPLSEACLHKIKSVAEMGLYPGVVDEFMIVNEDDRNGRVVVSLRKLQSDVAWERVRQMQAEDVTVRGKIISANRGGIVVMVESLRAFLPFSQTSPGKNTEEWVGKELPLKFIEVDEEQTRLVVSNRKAQAESQVSLGIGSVVLGTVQTVKPYGAFIDLGGVNGLLHISQVSHERITTLDNVLQPGDKLKVMILSQDRERDRISLSTKKLEPTPGDMLRNPALVFEKAEEMAMSFRQRVAQAEAAARAEEAQFEDGSFGLGSSFLSGISGGTSSDQSSLLFSDKETVNEDFLSRTF